MKAVLFGYGRAGVRHGRLLESRGIDYIWIDPAINESMSIKGLKEYVPDFAVICSPPELHYQNISQVLEAGVKKIVCEKPLCSWGQIDLFDSLLNEDITITYNWRWHKDYKSLKMTKGDYMFYSDQYRSEIPEWGLLLDHISHTIDLLLWLGGPDIEITHASRNSHNKLGDWWHVKGRIDKNSFAIYDRVVSRPGSRSLWIQTPSGKIKPDIGYTAISNMFGDMWDDLIDWINGDRPAPVLLDEAIQVQRVLEQIKLVNDQT